MKAMDATGKRLLVAAALAESGGLGSALSSPYDGLYVAIRLATPAVEDRSAMINRVFDACGTDNVDLDNDEVIDSLIAAAYWRC